MSHIINNLITSTVRSLRENLKPRPTVLTSLSLGQYGKASVWDFPVTTSLSVIKGQMQRNLDNFSFVEKPYKKVSYTIMKQNRLLKISFVRPVAHKTRKTDDFRELHENEQEMAALEWKRNYRYLWRHIWRAHFRDHIISLSLWGLFQGCPGVYWLADV